jgi:hypothetical protein
MDFGSKQNLPWIFLMLALIVFVAILLFSRSYYEGPPEKCEMTMLNVSVKVDGVPIENNFPEPNEVRPGAFVVIEATIEAETGLKIYDSASVVWLAALGSDPLRVQTFVEPTRAVFEITVGTRPEKDQIIASCGSTSGPNEPKRGVNLQVKEPRP